MSNALPLMIVAFSWIQRWRKPMQTLQMHFNKWETTIWPSSTTKSIHISTPYLNARVLVGDSIEAWIHRCLQQHGQCLGTEGTHPPSHGMLHDSLASRSQSGAFCLLWNASVRKCARWMYITIWGIYGVPRVKWEGKQPRDAILRLCV